MDNMVFDVHQVKSQWKKLTAFLALQFKEEPDLQAVVFLIGVHELGMGRRDFSKQEKTDLMHVATCKLLSRYDFYRFSGLDDDGWPHYEKLKPIPALSLKDQDLLLKKSAIEYFEENKIFIPE